MKTSKRKRHDVAVAPPAGIGHQPQANGAADEDVIFMVKGKDVRHQGPLA